MQTKNQTRDDFFISGNLLALSFHAVFKTRHPSPSRVSGNRYRTCVLISFFLVQFFLFASKKCLHIGWYPHFTHDNHQCHGEMNLDTRQREDWRRISFNFVVTQPTAIYIQPNHTPNTQLRKVDIPGPLLTTMVKRGLSASQFIYHVCARLTWVIQSKSEADDSFASALTATPATCSVNSISHPPITALITNQIKLYKKHFEKLPQ